MKDDDLYDRLARLRVEQADPGQGGRQTAFSRAAMLWRRTSRRRRRGDALLLATGALIAGVIIAAIVVLTSNAIGGGQKEQASAGIIQRTPTVVRRSSPSPAPTMAASVTPAPATAQTTYRQDCAAILGTPYQSEAERVWFIANCAVPAEPVPGDGVPPPQPTLAPPPAPTPTPVPRLTASQAISRAVDWLASQGIGIDTGSCGASSSGSTWTVSCESNTTVCIQQSPIVIWLC